MTSYLRERAATTPEMLAIYDDRAVLRHALAFEAALARATQAPAIADSIARACATIEIDPAALADEAAHAGTLAIPLVARLRAALDGAAAEAVHRGATSQDLADTVMMLQAREAGTLLDRDLARLTDALAELAEREAETPAIGRTLLQDALPVTFGLRAAQWLAGIDAAARAFRRALDEALILQSGGPVGASRIELDLGLGMPIAPWHARRTHVAALGAALGLVIGAIGKLARDVGLLAQAGIGEQREPRVAGRGGSSAMSHKRNPTGAQVASSAAVRAPGLVATLLSAMPQELERGLGGWQAEAPVLAELFLLAGGAARAMADAAEGLELDRSAIAGNLARAGVGADTGDAAGLARALVADYRKGR
jgi:3-carboxy-cis,cis-muconate cycloisomerase